MAQALAHAPSADSRPAQLPHLYRALYDLDGRRFVWTLFSDSMAVWPWVVSEVAEHFDCYDDDVGLLVDDDGAEVITIAGNPVAYLYSRRAR